MCVCVCVCVSIRKHGTIYSKGNIGYVMERKKEDKAELSKKKQGKINLQIMITFI